MYKLLLVIIICSVGLSAQGQGIVNRPASETIIIVTSKHHTDRGAKKNVPENKSPQIVAHKKGTISFLPLKINRSAKESARVNITRSEAIFHNKKTLTIRSKDSLKTKEKSFRDDE